MSNAICVRTTTAILQPGCDFRVAGDATRMQAFVRDALGISHHTDYAEEYAELLNGGMVMWLETSDVDEGVKSGGVK